MAKLFLTIVGALIIQLYYIHAESHPPNIPDIYAYCSEKANISQEEMDAIRSSDKNITEYADNYNYKCYWNCFMEVGGVLRDGVFLYEETREKFGYNKNEHTRKFLQAIMDKCQHSTDGAPNNCEAAYQHAVCTSYWWKELNGRKLD